MIQRAVIAISTTGLDPKKHAIIELTALRVDTQYEIQATFSSRIRHSEMLVDPESMAYNGIDIRDSSSWPTAEQAKEKFLQTFGIKPDVLHGAKTSNHIAVCGLKTDFTVRYLREFFGDAVYDQVFSDRTHEFAGLFDLMYDLRVVTRPPRSGRLVDLVSALGAPLDDLDVSGELSSRVVAEVCRRGLYKIGRYCSEVGYFIEQARAAKAAT